MTERNAIKPRSKLSSMRKESLYLLLLDDGTFTGVIVDGWTGSATTAGAGGGREGREFPVSPNAPYLPSRSLSKMSVSLNWLSCCWLSSKGLESSLTI